MEALKQLKDLSRRDRHPFDKVHAPKPTRRVLLRV